MPVSKKKCCQYHIEYIKYGFIQSPTNESLPMCLICQRVFTNEAMKPSRLQENLFKMRAEKRTRIYRIFKF